MSEKLTLITPKYLTRELAQRAVLLAVKAATVTIDPYPPILEQAIHCHIVILVPGREDNRQKTDSDSWPDYSLQPVALYESSHGGKCNWQHEFDKVARSKAEQLWTDCNDSRNAVAPHLLFPGDTPYWGGVKRNGIVVTCSGFDECIDQLISGIVADILVGLAQQRFDKDPTREGHDFLPR